MRSTQIKADDRGGGFHFYIQDAQPTDQAKVDKIIIEVGLYGKVATSPFGPHSFAGSSLALLVKGSRVALEIVQECIKDA